jgi:ketosteroid isomerase-like protein
MNRFAASLLAGSLAGCVAVADTAFAPPFRPAVEAHLSAIASRNMEALIPTITTGEDLVMIAPNGMIWETRQQYVDFHRQWFASPDGGKLDYEIVHTVESPQLSHALIRYTYTTTAHPQSEPTWLALTFALEEGAWRLVFDQNTSISPPPA